MNNQRIKAFTIMEVTIAMLLASITIGITYAVYSIIVRSHASYNIKNNDTASVIRLDELIKNDFKNADIILKSQQGVIFKNTVNEVNYEIKPYFILRNAGIVDTFKVSVQQIKMSFEKNELLDYSTSEEDNEWIDELELTFLFEGRKIPYHYYKQYSALNLMEKN